ncbi:MAG: aminotransferase class III-fold pyridoxal phosphate-dependent enzyme [Methylacidiphilales bacterium]|nr:aminotransferase class III-fold pyridoxal phosphate-dependent enzyme [Candidatus Methylacidiphilales bacterium]MDW8349825.1 aminotransferase class III-fold pyridoxal phosphate-dependent enzyme [Verrucomicrobiae bacterium]
MLPHLVTSIPGPRSKALAETLARYECRNITFLSPEFPIFWERARWANVWDVDGNRYLDFTSAFGVAGNGFTPQAVVEAIQHQASLLIHGMGDVHPHMPKVDLCRILSALTYESWGIGEGKTILTNSGSEAVEAALATAYLATGKPGVIAFDGGYHGLTLAARSATGLQEFRLPFSKLILPEIFHLPYPTCYSCGQSPSVCQTSCRSAWEAALEDLLKKNQDRIGAVIVEPIQGRGGCRIPPDWFLPRLRELCDEKDWLLIADEIFTGGWRTGRRFGCDWTATVPDLICLSKAITGGFPLGACVGPASLMDAAWPPSQGEALFTSTHLGHPIGCRMAIAAISGLEDANVPVRVTQAGDRLLKILEGLATTYPSLCRNARGKGLMLGLDCADMTGKPLPQLCQRLISESLKLGMLILSGGAEHHTLTLTPPYCINHEELDYFESRMQIILASLQTL